MAIDQMVDRVLGMYVEGHSNLLSWQRHFNNCLVDLQVSLKEVEEEKRNASEKLGQLRAILSSNEKAYSNEYATTTKSLIDKINEKSSRMEALSIAVSKLKLQNTINKINLKLYTDIFPSDVKLHDSIYEKYQPNSKALEMAAKNKYKTK